MKYRGLLQATYTMPFLPRASIVHLVVLTANNTAIQKGEGNAYSMTIFDENRSEARKG